MSHPQPSSQNMNLFKALLPKTPLAMVIVTLVTYLTIGHLNQQREYQQLRDEIRTLKESLLSQIKSQSDQLGQSSNSLLRLGEQLVQHQERVKALEDSLRLERGTQMKAFAQLREELDQAKQAQADWLAATEKLKREVKSEIATLLEGQPDLSKKVAKITEPLPPQGVQAAAVSVSELNSNTAQTTITAP